MSEVAEKAAEITAEVVEESIDGVVDVVEVVRNNPIALAAVGIVALAAGAAGGYFVAKKQLASFYEDLASQEIAEAKEFYANLNKVDDEGKVLTPLEVLEKRHGAEAAAEAVREYQGREAAERIVADEFRNEGEPYDDQIDEEQILKIERELKVKKGADGVVDVIDEESVTTKNVFKDLPEFDLELEKALRTKEEPYIITHEEFFEATKDYDTSRLTYFEASDTLVDEHEHPIREVNETVGDDHLVRFGSGSKDPNIVYVRNDRMETDFEIVLSTGSYVKEVLGFGDEEEENSLKHSNRQTQQQRRREFRHGDG